MIVILACIALDQTSFWSHPFGSNTRQEVLGFCQLEKVFNIENL